MILALKRRDPSSCSPPLSVRPRDEHYAQGVEQIAFVVDASLVPAPFLLGGAPDTSARRAVAFVASAFFAGMFFFGGAWVLLLPVALIGLMRTPTSVRPMMWALGMGVPAFAMGWLVTTV